MIVDEIAVLEVLEMDNYFNIFGSKIGCHGNTDTTMNITLDKAEIFVKIFLTL